MERIIVTNKAEMESATQKALKVLESGGVILYPTDTLYGLGVDAANKEAVEQLYDIKRRDREKPVSVMVADMEIAEVYVVVSSLAKSLAKKVFPGPFTFVLPKQKAEHLFVGKEMELGIRIPNSDFCLSLAKKFGKPITATSANVSGKSDERNIDAILEQLGTKKELIDLVIDVGELPERDASTVLKIEGNSVEVLREGNVNHTVMLNVTKEE